MNDNAHSTDGTAQLPDICSLCGTSDVQVRVQLKEDSEVAHRVLCEVHAAKLEKFWKQEQARREVRTLRPETEK